MTLKFYHTDNEDILVVNFDDSSIKEDFLSYKEKINQKISLLAEPKIIIRFDQLFSLISITEMYNYVVFFKNQLPLNSKLAFLFNTSVMDSDIVKFAEDVAHNRGLTLKVFDKENDAIDWLNNNRN